MPLKLGCDPEAFLIDLEGTFRSSIGKVGGTKYDPQPLPLGEGYAVQEDNVAIEFNIPPAETRVAFVDSIRNTLNYLIEFSRDINGLVISTVSAASFPDEELQDPRALEFGCEPDFNAWTKDVNPKPSAADKNLRSCGGHVHIGFDNEGVDKFDVIKYMDLFTGVPSVLMDKGEMRKELYGKAGACRIKSYGAEYRTLSNFWIFDNRLIEWVWDNTSRAVAAAESRLAISEEDGTDIVNAINNNDKQLAQKLVNKFNLEVVNV
jgi:hypothetical protein